LKKREEGEITVISLDFSAAADGEVRETLYCVANALSDAIVNGWEPVLIRDILDREYGFLDVGERVHVVQQVNGEMSPGGEMTRYKIRRKGVVLERLFEYLESNDHLSVDGFVAFRLQDYVEALTHRIDESVNDLLVAQEYAQWTQLLRDLSLPDLDSPEIVHAFFDPERGWELRDADGCALRDRLLGEYSWWYVQKGLDHPDLLITSLIMLRPKSIVVHDPWEIGDHLGVVSSLEDIFLDRLQVCPGCPHCDSDE
jgi:putative sporulation protein YtxC